MDEQVPEIHFAGSLPTQIAFGELALNPEAPGGTSKMFGAMLGGVGFGKTRGVVMSALTLAAANPGCDGMIIEPEHKQIDAPLLPMIREVCEGAVWNEKVGALVGAVDEKGDPRPIEYKELGRERSVWLPEWGAKIWLRNGSDPTNLRGPNLAWGILDESTYQQEEVFAVTDARVRDSRATMLRVLAFGSPRGLDWNYEMFVEEDGPRRIPGSVFIGGTSAENFYNPDGYAEGMRHTRDPETYLQDVMGEFRSIGQSATYFPFTRSGNIVQVQRNPDWPLIVMAGFSRSPLPWVFGQWNPDLYRLECLAELAEITDTKAACDWTRTRFGSPGSRTVYQVWMDGTPGAPTISRNFSDSEVIREVLVCSPKVSRRLPRLRDRTLATNALLLNAAGARRLVVDPACRKLIRDFEQQKNIPGSFNLDDRNPEIGHFSRAVSVYAVSEHPIIAGREAA